MRIVDHVKKTITEFPSTTPNPEELARLQQFSSETKDIGVAKARQYGIPRPDTIGRVLVNTRGKGT